MGSGPWAVGGLRADLPPRGGDARGITPLSRLCRHLPLKGGDRTDAFRHCPLPIPYSLFPEDAVSCVVITPAAVPLSRLPLTLTLSP